MTSPVAAATANPFVGPHALTEADSLFGRNVELKRLYDVLIAERIVLLYSPSGAGKTSLLHAGLKRLLVRDGFVVLPTIRVTHEVPPVLAELSVRNRYVLSTLLSLEAGRENELEPAKLATIRLDEYLAETRAASSVDAAECLVFDQFEELFMVDPIDEEAKEMFLEEVGHALRDRGRWAVFSMREDFVAHLDPYLKLIPTRLRTRFRLDLLRPEPALQAIQGPAREAGVEFSTDAAALVVDDLRTVLVQRGGAAVPAEGPTVEPVQLQVVCHRLWTRLGDTTTVEPEHVRELGDVDNALRDFYDDVVRQVAQSTNTSERALRTWISDELVTEQGYRTQVQHGPTGDAEGRVLPELENAHLVRADRRRATVWYELAHDRLVDPIQSSNAAWLEEHLSDVQRGARLWDAQRRDDRTLLVGPQLEAADAWAEQHPNELGDVEQEFLGASRKEAARIAREQRSARRTRRMAIVATLVSLAAIAGLIAAIWQWQRVEDEKERAQRTEQAMTYFFAGQEALSDPQKLLLDRMALEAFPDDTPPPVFMLHGINSHLYENHVAGNLEAGPFPAMSGNGRFIADQTNEGARVVDLDASEGAEPLSLIPLEQPFDFPESLSLNQDGTLLAVGPASAGPIQLWDVTQEELLHTLPAPSSEYPYWQLDFSESAGVLAGLNLETQDFLLWEVTSGEVITPPQLESLGIHMFDLSATGLIAAGDAQSSVQVFDLNTGTELPALPTGDVGLTTTFDQAGERLAVMMIDRVEVYAIQTRELLGTVPISVSDWLVGVSDWFVGFRSGDRLLSVTLGPGDLDDLSDPGELCTLREWMVTGELVGETELDCSYPIALSGDGERLLTTGDDGWSVWSTADGSRLETSASPEGTVSAGGSIVARIDSVGRVVVSTLAGEVVYTTPRDREFQQVVVDGDGDTIIASTGEDLVVIDVPTGKVQSSTTLRWQPEWIATSDGARLVAIASPDGQLLRWNARDKREPEELPHSGEITSLAVTGSGRAVAVATTNAMTFYTDADERPITIEEQVIEVATDPGSDALATVVTRQSRDPTERPLPLPGSPTSEEADPSSDTDLLLWDDVNEEPERIELRLGRATGLALTQEHVVIASDQGIDVYDRRNLGLVGGFKLDELSGGSLRTVELSVSNAVHPTVASITSDGTTGFTFHLDPEGIRDDLEAAANEDDWKDLDDSECRRIAGIDCL